MVTIKVHNQYVTWPNDFAVMMMRYYKRHGVPFVIQRNNASAVMHSVDEDSFLDAFANQMGHHSN